MIMPRARSNESANTMTDSVMIDVFKRKILAGKLDLRELKGSWEEASELLLLHFGKLSRVMLQNQGKLHRLYQDTIAEMRKA
jgi:hypothetical protein